MDGRFLIVRGAVVVAVVAIIWDGLSTGITATFGITEQIGGGMFS
jgi:hypothetical protein